MDIFEQPAHAAASPVTSASSALAHGAARVGVSIARSVKYLPADVAANLLQVLTIENLQTLALVLAGWVIATVIGGLIGLAINGLLVVYGLYELYGQASETWQVLRQWAVAAYSSKDDSELDAAARLFAEAVSQGAVVVIEAVVTHRIFVKIKKPLTRRFPAPEALKAEYERAVKERLQAEEGSEQKGRRKSEVAGERSGRKSESAGERPSERIAKAGETVADLARGEGLKHSGDFPTGAVVVGALTLGLAATVAVATLGGGRGK